MNRTPIEPLLKDKEFSLPQHTIYREWSE